MSSRYWVERNLYQKSQESHSKNLHFWDQTCQFFEHQPVPCRDSGSDLGILGHFLAEETVEEDCDECCKNVVDVWKNMAWSPSDTQGWAMVDEIDGTHDNFIMSWGAMDPQKMAMETRVSGTIGRNSFSFTETRCLAVGSVLVRSLPNAVPFRLKKNVMWPCCWMSGSPRKVKTFQNGFPVLSGKHVLCFLGVCRLLCFRFVLICNLTLPPSKCFGDGFPGQVMVDASQVTHEN